MFNDERMQVYGRRKRRREEEEKRIRGEERIRRRIREGDDEDVGYDQETWNSSLLVLSIESHPA